MILVFDNVTSQSKGYVKNIIQNLWAPLVSAAQDFPQVDHRMLLFLIDNLGKMGEQPLQISTAAGRMGELQKPVSLPELCSQFSEADLKSWLVNEDTLALPPIHNRLMADREGLVAEILRNSDGIPMFVLRAICQLCDYKWNDLKKEWLRL